MFLGWQVGLTFQVKEELSRDDLLRLLDEVCEYGFNAVSFIMDATERYVPPFDGLNWPVDSERLKILVDPLSRNATARGEFLSGIIQDAKRRGLHVNLTYHYGFNNLDKVRTICPEAMPRIGPGGKSEPHAVCCNSPGVHELQLEIIRQMLQRYVPSGASSFMIEGPQRCRCQ